jgi:hypothetical protein
VKPKRLALRSREEQVAAARARGHAAGMREALLLLGVGVGVGLGLAGGLGLPEKAPKRCAKNALGGPCALAAGHEGDCDTEPTP